MNAWIAEMKYDGKEKMACKEAAEVNPKKVEPNPEMRQFVEEHREVLKAEAAVKSSGAMKKRNRGGI
jgi:hypothetical protein